MSSFSWIAFSDDERERTLDIISQFQEQDTRDELGIGRIRDALAALLFPGTSTIQTRARYFLFVPWMYRELERKRVPSEEIRDRVESYENKLIRALLGSDDTDGVIGKQAQEDLQRYPSEIYWGGLWTWDIRRFGGSQGKYYSTLDDYYTLLGRQQRTDTEDPIGAPQANWDESLPSPPAGFPNEATLKLTADEASYLKNQIHEAVPDSMLSAVLEIGELESRTDFPWQYPRLSKLPESVQESLHHARNFSEVIHGAALLYNLMLAQQRADEELIDTYEERLEEWAGKVIDRRDALEAWDLDRFWDIIEEHSASTPIPMVRFVEDWIDIALASPREIPRNDTARRLVREREIRLKRGQSRLTNQRALELWGGDAGSSQLAFRWRITQTHLEDIFEGLDRS